MGKIRQRRRLGNWQIALCFSLLMCFADRVSTHIRYSVPEEVNDGAVVGNLAKDLGLEVSSLVDRRFRIVSGTNDALFRLNQNNGVLYVHTKIDREQICDVNNPCVIDLKVVVESPLEVHYVGVDITDINDHAPAFPDRQQRLEIAESTLTGARFQLQSARDPDIGVNSVHAYKISNNENFDLEIRDRGDEKVPFLVLQKSLDRERKAEHELTLTAVDGGNPPKSGILNVTVTVLDNNDNRPVFSQEVYTVHLQENSPIGTTVVKVSATDLDDGSNGEVIYSLSNKLSRNIYDVFDLNATSGEIVVKSKVDYENTDVYRLDVLASDKGTPPMTVDCRVIVKILDINDNAPEIEIMSLSNSVPENSKPGTVISLISVLDKDAGVNGKVLCTLSQDIPFELKPSAKDNMYSLITKSRLDREETSRYDITLTALDMGQPPQTAQTTLSVQVSDVNDNCPEFSQNPIEIYVIENNTPGGSIFSVTASDKDINENAIISYNILRGDGAKNMPLLLSINSETGVIHALKSFDYELAKTFQFHVQATDSGIPSLSSNVTVNVFILDQNDNAPVILYPVSANGSAEGVEEIPRNVNAGHLVTKVRAYDADIGYNGWLLFSLLEVSDHSLFGLDRYTGQTRTLRPFTETDESGHKLVILVKDNGNVSLSATATVFIKLVEPKEAFAATDVKNSVNDEDDNNITFYLIITLGSVSVLFVISVIVLIIMQCSKTTDNSSKYLQDTNYDGTLCHSIQYRSGDKRYMLVGPRTSIGSTLVSSSNGNTLVLPDRRSKTSRECSKSTDYSSKYLQDTNYDGTLCHSIQYRSGDKRYMLVGPRTSIGSTLVPGSNGNTLVISDRGRKSSGEIRYSIAEESLQGSVVGNIAKDLGLDVNKFKDRRFRIVSGSKDSFLQINQDNGALFVSGNIDREELCEKSNVCTVNLKTVAENPLEIYYIEVEILDINDNSPIFPVRAKHLEISENAVPQSTRLPLDAARDLDAGVNSLRKYILSPNNHFELDVKTREEEKIPFLILKKQLDREEKHELNLTLTAYDGGKPERFGSLNITITVVDINDNAPVFDRQVYTVTLEENIEIGSSVVKLHATDLDEGDNGQVVYAFDKSLMSKAFDKFEINSHTGEIIVKGSVDFEEHRVYEIDIKASDKGPVSLTGHCSVIINIKDINDNAPEIEVTSLSTEILEDSNPGTAISLISVSDRDSETDENEHKLVILVKDNGNVSLSATATVIIKLVEPKETFASFDVKSACSKSTDYSSKYLQDTHYDGTLCNSIQYRSGNKQYMLVGPRMSIGSTIVSGSNGNTLVIPDHRKRASGEIGRAVWRKPHKRFFFVTILLLFEGTTRAQIQWSVLEEQNDGTLVGNIAKDLGIDHRILKERGLRIVSSSADSRFTVNPDDGGLYVNGKIDREVVCTGSTACLDNLKIILENPPEIHYVSVHIIDINDNAPNFIQKTKHLDIGESALPGTRFQLQAAHDPDSGSNSIQSYKLSNNDHFRLEVKDRDEDGKIPILILQKQLDREAAQNIKLLLTAVDGGKPSKSGTMEVIINVLDINDNAPVFTEDVYTVMLPENAPIGTTVIRMNATDLDDGSNGEIVYSIGNNVNSKLRELFEISPITGEIIVKGVLDFEAKDKYEIDIQASDKGLVPMISDKTVTIKIVDVNDNAPEIEVTSFSSAIPEDSRSGTTVALISVSDADSGVNGKVSCSVPEDMPFKLLKSSRDNVYSLVTSSTLDRELASQYVITLSAKDAGNPPLSSIKTITIQVLDVNDNIPEFISSLYTFYVTENNAPGSSLFSVLAFDRDTNENALINYQIWRDNLKENKYTSFINVNSESGEIYALKVFDFETIKTFQFHVLATDSGTPPLSSNVTVNVFILDQNDNVPVILYPVSANGSAEGVQEIPRNANAGHLVTKVRAFDADIGYNGWLLFSLQEVSDHSLFGLDRYTGQIRTLRPFTETDEAEHKLVILVKDNGNVSLSATTTLIIKIVEPKEPFAAADFKNTVKEEGENNVTFYLIITLGSVSFLFIISIIVLIVMQCSNTTDYSSKFLQDTNYDGTLCHSIQYRSGDKRYMLVGPRTSIGSTLISASNGNTLVLPDRKRRTSVEDDGTLVGHIVKDLGINAKDLKDRGFRIVSSSQESLFEVNQNDGALYLRGNLDRETVCEKSISCTIELKIAMENPLEIYYVTIEITDMNDHAPVFTEKEAILEIWESALPGTRFQLQPAHDPDSGSNSIQTYKLSQNDYFRLEVKDRDEDGKIPILILQKQLDREAAQNIKILLTAVDGGKPSKSGTMEVIINVLDINDNAPVFTEDVYTVMLPENAPIGTTVLCMNATDLDDGLNGEIVYSIGKNVNNKLRDLFEISAITGEIIVKGIVDFEIKDKYEIDIQASDKGLAPMISDKTVTIKIVDVNDNAPEIEVTSFSSAIPEDSRSGTTVALISVSDADSGVNGKVSCSVPEDMPFKLLKSSRDNVYSLVTSSTLDRELASQYVITLSAKDAGNPPLSSMKTITVQVSDVNDNIPEFISSPYTFYVMENNAPGSSLFSVLAFDQDTNENSVIRYQIWRDNRKENKYTSFINVNSESGEIYALKVFDFETIKTFQFHVLATDSGTPPLSSNVTVNVFILDQNDNVPVILYPVSANGSAGGEVEEIPRNANAGHLVTKVRAYDADIGYNGWLLFSLQDVSDHSLFVLDRYTGQIRTLRPFTETDEAKHKLVILVKDNGNVSLSATTTLLIKIVEPKEAFAASDVKNAAIDMEENNVTFYLIITLGSVSFLFIISIIVFIGLQCSPSTDYSSKSLQDTNYDGTLCHSIQYRSGEKRYMLVGPRTSIGSTLVSGSNGNTLVIPDRRRRPSGEPSLSSVKRLTILVSDINDNSPEFSLSPYTFYVTENNIPGMSLFCVSASDKDTNENAVVTYYIMREKSEDNKNLQVNINSENGCIHALKPFDFEGLKMFQFHVLATDSGTPSLRTNVTVIVYILDQNDNVPVILYPISANGSSVEEIPRNVNAGHLVTKVRAYDADVGYNGWLLFSLQEVSDHSLFGLDRYTGQIRTLRPFTETDEAEHKLVILVKDNGNISLSATASVIIKLVEPKEAFVTSDVKNAVNEVKENNVTFYLIITLGSVSFLFIVSIIVLIVMQCSKSTDYNCKYLQDTNYDGTLCHSIQYRSGDKRYMLVGPRTSIGSTLVPGSNANTLVIQDRRRRTSGEDHRSRI
ncbi:Protocadherin gamma-A11 [Bagarius yarrelli]|uniref:Protocadherin gamma-A11 n=1 Tax=Bagarius yarrelli TaxID=175774 RepID=A0A556TRR7_BAGYA|nr:Protocadherin gamma-A11 [Bagarius yarrelli]